MFQQENYDPEAAMSMVTLSAVKIDEEGNVEDVNVEDPIPQDGMLAGCEAGPGTGKGGVFVRTCTIQVFGPDGMPRGRQATYRNGYKRAMQAFLLLDGKSMVDAKTLREMEQMMRDVDRIEAEAKKFEQEQARLNGSGK